MATYLFTWVPENYETLYDDYEKWLARGSVNVPNWSSGVSKSIPSGERVFVMAQKPRRRTAERRGVIARGITISPTRSPGTPPNANDNNLRLEEMSHPASPLIPVEQLLVISRQKESPWNARASGIEISEGIAQRLEDAWAKAFDRGGLKSRTRVVYPNEVLPARFPEGTKRRVMVNSYERSDDAREACLDHYGQRCEVCGLDFEATYGPVWRGLIHVHHVKPLSEIGRAYNVDPVRDLRPICPNCHAMLHWTNPPLSIAALKRVIQK